MKKPKQTLCLNMIVKNEAGLIEQSLEKLLRHFTFHYWVICDTGSTDETKTIIRSFFQEKKIPGELIDTEWKDFGHNRTLALQNSYKKGDYVLIWDADDELKGTFVIPTPLLADAYSLRFSNDETNLLYSRPVLVNNHTKWKYVGVLHEYLAYEETGLPPASVHHSGEYKIQSGRSGARNKDPCKFAKDAEILRKALLETDPMTQLYGRYAFYCGNSYYNAKQYKESLQFYEAVLVSNAWIQEKFVSCLRMYEAFENLGEIEKGLPYLERSYIFDSCRVECIYRLIKHYCIKGRNNVSLSYYANIQNYYEKQYLQDNIGKRLFAYNMDYTFHLPYFMIIVSEKTKQYEIGLKMYDIMFQTCDLGPSVWHLNNVFFNIQFFFPCFSTKTPEYMLAFLKSMIVYINTLKTVKNYQIERKNITHILQFINALPCKKLPESIVQWKTEHS